jgi:hypothetical protein
MPRPLNLGAAGFAELRLAAVSPFLDRRRLDRVLAVSLKHLRVSGSCRSIFRSNREAP